MTDGVTDDPDPSSGERILVVAAHPDDIDFACAGTVALWTRAGAHVAYCIATSGDAGGVDESERDRMGPRREAEQRAAAAAVGVSDVTFLGYPDGELTASRELRRDLSRVIRRHRPSRIVLPSPERMWDRLAVSHPDHLAAGEAGIRAVYPDARNPFAHPELRREGLDPWTVRDVWLVGHPGSDHHVDVTDTAEQKRAALAAHVSQGTDAPELWEGLRSALAEQARAAGLGAGRLAERFTRIRIEN